MRLKCRLHTVDDTIRARHEFISALIQDFKRTQRVSQSPMYNELRSKMCALFSNLPLSAFLHKDARLCQPFLCKKSSQAPLTAH